MSKKLLGHLTKFTTTGNYNVFLDCSKIVAVRPLFEEEDENNTNPVGYKMYLNDDHEDDRFEVILTETEKELLGLI